MTLSEHHDDAACEHTQSGFSDWYDVYECESRSIRLIRECEQCGEQEEYILEPDTESEFQQEYAEWEQKQLDGEIADVSLAIDEASGINAFVHITVERGDGTGPEVVSDSPYYFFY